MQEGLEQFNNSSETNPPEPEDNQSGIAPVEEGEFSSTKPRGVFGKINRFIEKRIAKKAEIDWEAVGRVINKFGESLEILDIDTITVVRQLETLDRLPERLVEIARAWGVKIKIGYTDLDELIDEKRKKNMGDPTALSWASGIYFSNKKEIYVGKKSIGTNTTLHEFGHFLGDAYGWNRAPQLDYTHRQMFNNLRFYLQQDGPGSFRGREELFADSFAYFYLDSKEDFIAKYGEYWYEWLGRFIEHTMKNATTKKVA